MKVLNDTGAGCDVEIHLNHTTDRWTIRITDATLDAVARGLAGLGLGEFRVNVTGLTGDEPP